MGARGRKGAVTREVEAFVTSHRAPKPSVVRPDAPSHLREDGASFFVLMRQAHDIEGPASIAILTRAAECIDRIAAARTSIAKNGEIIENQYGVAKMNPACALEKAARDGFFAAMRLLGIHMSAGNTRESPPWAIPSSS
jgi:phage terminase small subunit